MTQEERDALDRFVLDRITEVRSTASALTITSMRKFDQSVDKQWFRKVDGSLQRLRKRGLIAAERVGSTSLWHRCFDPPSTPSTPTSTNMDYARAVEAHGALDVAVTISKAISLIDVSKTARSASGYAIADAYLNDARTMLLGLIGIEVES